MVKQENVNKEFTDKDNAYERDWKEAGFDSNEAKEWIEIGLGTDRFIFAWWLKEEKKLVPRQGLNIEEKSKEYNDWIRKLKNDISRRINPIEIMKWKKRGFDFQEIKKWVDAGLTPKEYRFASQLKENNITPQQYSSFPSKNAQEWIDYFYPQEKRDRVEELNISKKGLKYSLKLTNFIKLKKLNCSENQLTNLDLSDCVNLKEIDCSKNQLDSLIVSNLSNLQELKCSENKLTNIDCRNCKRLQLLDCKRNELNNLDLNNCLSIVEFYCNINNLSNLDFLQGLLLNEKLEIINSGDNNITDLLPLKRFVNLREMYLGNNKLTGSLEFLKCLNKLEKLDISDTDIDSGLEYLPDSIKSLYCSSSRSKSEKKVKLIEEELSSYVTNESRGEYNFSAWRDENIVKMVPTLPPSLVKEKEGKLEENYYLKKKYYDNKIYPETSRKIDENRVLSPKELPTRLYNIEDKKLTEEKTDIKNYAILSYVWGQAGDLSDEAKNELGSIWNDVKYKNDVNPAGYKSWKKAIEACQHPSLNINYLWMDQLCINQSDNEEKAAEVPKMGQYYSNAAVTLIGIQVKAKIDEEELDLLDILKNITCSEWFTRSWTFQEGWLSKWTLFMFDDILVDGREMAALWVFQQPSHVGISFSKEEKGLKKIATPIGWVHYQKGYKSEDKVSLRLHEVLREIKNRGRGNPVDGIYSTLGLLPYGNDKDIKVEYKPRKCELCEEGIEQKNCKHEEKHKKWATYTTKDLEERLLHIMKIAIKNGYGEPLAWHGMGNGWLPQINEQGSTTIEGGIKVDYVSQNEEEIFQSDGSLKITGAEYVITKSSSTMSRWDQSSSIESGARERKIEVVVNDKEEELELSGTKTILSVMSKLVKEEKNDIRLLIPNRYQWKSTKSFAILVEIKENNHYGLGLVEISEGSEKLQEEKEKEIIIQRKSIIWASEKEKEISVKEELQTKWQNLQKQIAELSIQEQERLLMQIQIEVNKN